MRVASKIIWALALAWSSLAVAGCGNDGGGSPDGGGGSGGAGGSGQPTDGAMIDTGHVGCLESPATTCPNPPVTYAQIDSILQARCASVCHNGTTPDPANNNMPIWGLRNWDDMSDWRDTIRLTMNNCSMPPADAGVPLTIEERRKLVEFIACGLPK
jgi:hypothetical protein